MSFLTRALHSIRRAVRVPIISFLAGDDLVIVGDIYCSVNSDPLIKISGDQNADLLGSIRAHDGPSVIVPRGHRIF